MADEVSKMCGDGRLLCGLEQQVCGDVPAIEMLASILRVQVICIHLNYFNTISTDYFEWVVFGWEKIYLEGRNS